MRMNSVSPKNKFNSDQLAVHGVFYPPPTTGELIHPWGEYLKFEFPFVYTSFKICFSWGVASSSIPSLFEDRTSLYNQGPCNPTNPNNLSGCMADVHVFQLEDTIRRYCWIQPIRSFRSSYRTSLQRERNSVRNRETRWPTCTRCLDHDMLRGCRRLRLHACWYSRVSRG